MTSTEYWVDLERSSAFEVHDGSTENMLCH